MEKARMLGMEQSVVVGGTEGGRSPTGVPPTTTAAAAVPGGPGTGNGKPMPDPAVPEKPVRATVHRRVQNSHPPRGGPLYRAWSARGSAASGGAILVAPEHVAAATRARDAGRVGSQASSAEATRRPLIAENERLKARISGWRQAPPGRSDHRGSKKTFGGAGDSPAAVGEQRERAMKAVEELSPR